MNDSQTNNQMPPAHRKHVAIVGGGLAGLCCAHHLQQAGIDFTVFESTAQLGGRVQSDWVDGFLLDRGFQVLLTAYPAAQAILDYPALELRPFHPGALVRLDGRFQRFADPFRQPQHAWATAMSKIGTWSDKLRVARLKSFVLSETLEQIYQRPETTTLAALRERGFSEKIIQHFFKPFLGGVFLESELNTSSRMFYFVFKMFSAGQTAVPAAGMGQISKQLADRLPASAIRFNCPVRQVQADGLILENGQAVAADAVVLATPEPITRRLLGPRSTDPSHPQPMQLAPSEQHAWNAVTCFYYAAAKSPIGEASLVLNGEGRGPINNLCVPSDVSPTYAPDGQALISVSVLGDLADDREVRRQLEEWFGKPVQDWRLLKSYRIDQALPQQNPPHLSPVEKSPRINDSLFCCGDFYDTASIQGAFTSAQRAAQAAVDHLK